MTDRHEAPPPHTSCFACIRVFDVRSLSSLCRGALRLEFFWVDCAAVHDDENACCAIVLQRLLATTAGSRERDGDRMPGQR